MTYKRNNDEGSGPSFTGIGIVVIIGILAIGGFTVLALGFDAVDASHLGVKNQFGVIQGIMQPGMQWTGLFVDVYQYDLRMRRMEVPMTGSEGAVDKDGQSVYARIEINYRLNPDNIEKAYSRVGKDSELAPILNIDGIIREGFKETTSKYTSLEIFQKRQEVKEMAASRIAANFPIEYFFLENVIISNVDFNPAFKAAIERKKTAEENAKAAQTEVAISKAEADKRIEDARGTAESQKLAADAMAYETLAIARSEAESLGLKKAQLSPMMVQNNWIDAWDGALPQYMLGGNSNLLLGMPMGDDQRTTQAVTV